MTKQAIARPTERHEVAGARGTPQGAPFLRTFGRNDGRKTYPTPLPGTPWPKHSLDVDDLAHLRCWFDGAAAGGDGACRGVRFPKAVAGANEVSVSTQSAPARPKSIGAARGQTLKHTTPALDGPKKIGTG